jgi:hypothetical protein
MLLDLDIDKHYIKISVLYVEEGYSIIFVMYHNERLI